MDAAVTSAYAQMLSVGVLFIGLHCVGMCGPLLLGLDLGGCTTSPWRGGVWRHVLAYQLGKMIVYAMLGALAGALGGAVTSTLKHGAPILTGALGLALVSRPLFARRKLRLASPVGELVSPLPRGRRFASMLRASTLKFARERTLGGSFMLGMVLSMLPCMIVFWVLALAASTGSALHGAGVMVLLVVMNSAPLLGVTLLPRVVRNLAPLQRVSRHLLTFSGAWLMIVASASAELIPHAAIHFELLEKGYMLMFW